MTLFRQIITSSSFFRLYLEQFGTQIPVAWSIILTFSLIPFVLQKLKIELRNLQHSSHTIALKKGTSFTKTKNIFAKNTDISKSKWVPVLQWIFSKLHICEYLRTKFQVSRTLLTSFRQWGSFNRSPYNRKTDLSRAQKLTQIRIKIH